MTDFTTINAENAENIRRHFNLKQSSKFSNERFECPCCQGGRSLAINASTGWGYCHQTKSKIKPAEILESVGITPAKPQTRCEIKPDWIYDSYKGGRKFGVVKTIDDNGRKQMFQCRFENDAWHWGLDGFKGTFKPYQHARIENAENVIIVEGEKCADALQSRVAKDTAVITSIGGSQSPDKTNWHCLEKKAVIFIPDCDPPGIKYIEKIKRKIDYAIKREWMQPIQSAHVINLENDGVIGYDIADYIDENRIPLGEIIKLDSIGEKVEMLPPKRPNRFKWIQRVHVDPTMQGLEYMLDQLGYKIRYCVLKGGGQILEPGADKWVAIDDHNCSYLRGLIADKFTFGENNQAALWDNKNLMVAMNGVYRQNIVNSLCVDYLDKLKDWKPGMKTADSIFVDCLQTPDTPSTRAAGRMTLQALVARQYCMDDRGVKFDYMPILIGTMEGEGKSTFVEYMVPDAVYYGNRYRLNQTTERQIESGRGKAAIEVAEMLGRTESKIDKLKITISISAHPQCRFAWQLFESQKIVRHVFIGTTNEKTPIPMTGTRNRRFIPIEVAPVGAENVRKWWDRYRDEVYAHAIDLNKDMKKNKLYLTGLEEDEQIAAVRESTDVQQDLRNTLLELFGEQPYWRMVDLIHEIYCDTRPINSDGDQRDDISKARQLLPKHQKGIGKILRSEGFENAKIKPNGYAARGNYWYNPTQVRDFHHTE